MTMSARSISNNNLPLKVKPEDFYLSGEFSGGIREYLGSNMEGGQNAPVQYKS